MTMSFHAFAGLIRHMVAVTLLDRSTDEIREHAKAAGHSPAAFRQITADYGNEAAACLAVALRRMTADYGHISLRLFRQITANYGNTIRQ
jgi:hypothetical protein